MGVAKVANELPRFSRRLDAMTSDEIDTVHHEWWDDLVTGEFGYIGLQTADPQKHWKYVLKHFRRLRNFYHEAALARQAVIVYAQAYDIRGMNFL